ncbi:MAG: hypothetical protein ACM30I_04465 [Gemmatimonas sp.]
MVDGRFLKQDVRPTTVDVDKLGRDAADTIEGIERARQDASKPGAGEGVWSLFTGH